MKVEYKNNIFDIDYISSYQEIKLDEFTLNYTIDISEVKPYLFPVSSMAEEQEKELEDIYYRYNGMFQYAERIFDRIPFGKMKYFPYQVEEFFNRNHIDYRGLIPKRIALDATNLNIY